MDRIVELRKLLEYYNYLYYVKNEPVITDQKFDELMHELERLEAEHPEMFDPNSPTQRVGNDTTNEFVQVAHKYGMMSLANTYSEQEIRDFDERVRKGIGGDDVEYVCELKYDGTSISLRYEDGNLQVAVTRGDGVNHSNGSIAYAGGGLSRGVRDSGGDFNAFCRVQSIERGTAGGGRGFICQPAECGSGYVEVTEFFHCCQAAVGLLFILRAGRNHADPDTLREFNESEGMGV